jgi:hypothetical protein
MRSLLLVLLSLSMAACEHLWSTSMRPVDVDVIARQRSSATFRVEPGDGHDPVCLIHVMDTFCVHGVRREIEAGARTVLTSFLTPAQDAVPDYIARFGPLVLDVRAGGRGAPSSLVVTWEFRLTDARGEPVVALHDTTIAASPVANGEAGLDAPLADAAHDILERIRTAVGNSVVAH